MAYKPKVLSVSNGGTNATSMATSTGVVKYDGTSLVTSSTVLIDSSNRMLNASQPSFLAQNTTDPTNVTGDGTGYTVAYNSEIYDQNSNYNNGTYTFTAPVTGKYLLTAFVTLSGVLSTHTVGELYIITSNRNYISLFAPSKIFNNNTQFTTSLQSICDMDASDTASITVALYNGTKVIDILGSSGWSYFSGQLIC